MKKIMNLKYIIIMLIYMASIKSDIDLIRDYYPIFIAGIKEKYGVGDTDSMKISYIIPGSRGIEASINDADQYYIYMAVHKSPNITVSVNGDIVQSAEGTALSSKNYYTDYVKFIEGIKTKYSVRDTDIMQLTYDISGGRGYKYTINDAHQYYIFMALHKRPDMIVSVNGVVVQYAGSQKTGQLYNYIPMLKKLSPKKSIHKLMPKSIHKLRPKSIHKKMSPKKSMHKLHPKLKKSPHKKMSPKKSPHKKIHIITKSLFY